ncbi:rhodanese-like domain-containing protein [Breznakiella homolactica]|uniref:Rhodanese-like domain-containing protein n=2 Tax=Breznakiella homolactica TaxID=2798577 RepID=A0A7T7XS49_9SPIR|nr:rhodanese-like domain-containing protein [Breznakiella homolactica]
MVFSPVMEKIEAGALIVDVRTEDEFKTGAYPGAVNIPLAVLQSRMEELEPRDRPIVIYCTSGTRGHMAADFLEAFGWTDAVCAGSLTEMEELLHTGQPPVPEENHQVFARQ